MQIFLQASCKWRPLLHQKEDVGLHGRQTHSVTTQGVAQPTLFKVAFLFSSKVFPHQLSIGVWNQGSSSSIRLPTMVRMIRPRYEKTNVQCPQTVFHRYLPQNPDDAKEICRCQQKQTLLKPINKVITSNLKVYFQCEQGSRILEANEQDNRIGL